MFQKLIIFSIGLIGDIQLMKIKVIVFGEWVTTARFYFLKFNFQF